MTHAKDRYQRMLCNGCSPFDSSATTTYVHLWTLCPSCKASHDSREIPLLFKVPDRRFNLQGVAALAVTLASLLG